MVNAFVISVPWMIYHKSKNQTTDSQKIQQDSFALFKKLLMKSSFEMREALLNAIFNNLRYPNFITRYFMAFILLITNGSENEDLKEHVIRIEVERMITEDPHPWGLISTIYYNIKRE